MIKKNLNENYSPLYFLAALGAGGMAVSFFMYLMFMVSHKDTPMVTFNHLQPLLLNGTWWQQGLVGLAMTAIAVLAIYHIRLLIWNISEYRKYRRTEAFKTLKNSNMEVTLMSVPLTLAMTVNVMFVSGAVFIPNLWSVVEYLFPFAIAAFLAIGIYALRIFGEYMTRLISHGDFDFIENNNLSQMLAIFAFTMIGVGLAAPGAMSHSTTVSGLAIFLSIFFTMIAISLGVVKFILGFKSILKQGISEIGSPSLWIIIPILTLIGITLLRWNHGLSHGFNSHTDQASLFVLTSAIFSFQLIFGLIGYKVMKNIGYFDNYLYGDKSHPGSYALICPGVALFVFGMFFLAIGLVKTGLVVKFSVIFFILLAPLVYLQFKTLFAMLRLNKKLLTA